MAASRTPVTVITGFLGSGKTTLLRHVLTANHGRRIAVIQNELAEEAGIEAPSVTGADGQRFDEWVELANGCVCCSVKDDLVVALERLIERRGHFDYILVETTGMADPGPVASVFWVDEELDSPLYLDGIVTLVDGVNFMKHLHQVEACRQVASADCILLNKVDVASAEEVAHVESHLRQLNRFAPVLRTSHSAAALEALLDLQSLHHVPKMDTDAEGPTMGVDLPSLPPPPSTFGGAPVLCAYGHTACHRLHSTPNVGSVTITLNGEVDEDALNHFIGELLWERGESDIYRAKGVVAVAGEDCKFMLQAVHSSFELAPSVAWDPGEPRVSKLVFIGCNLVREDLEAPLQKCLSSAASAPKDTGG